MAARSRYSHVAITLHWLIAVLIVGNIIGGLAVDAFLGSADPAMKRTGFTIIQLHKSVGLTVLGLSLLRLAWRLINPAPPLPGHMTPLERSLAKASHWGFYALIVLLPLSGWALISGSPIRYPTFYFGLFEVPFLPLPQGKAIGDQLHEVHELLAFGTIALLGLHIAAALKHHFLDRDDVLVRMAPWVRARG